MAERTYTIEEVRKGLRKAVIRGTFLGLFAGAGFLMLIGETGGNFMRQTLEDERAAHAAYTRQCEATANRAVGATALAERVLEAR